MAPETIAFLDSGVGGLPYLVPARELLPGRRFVYVADRAHFPYGEKSADEITGAAIEVTARLVEREAPRLVVVACNTISVVALAALRERFPIPFVGVVPAVKPAAAQSRRRRVGVLATRQTVEGAYLKGLVESHAAGCVVVSLPAAGLVEFVETRLQEATPQERLDRVRGEVDRFRDAGVDTLVLGCTHFLHLEPEFRALLDTEGIALVDSREGVARQVGRLAGVPSPAAGPSSGDVLYVTGPAPVPDRYAWFAGRYGLRLDETLQP